ncbi:MAG TPA: PepSY-like domain-containing protein [Brumimicrobium sp.]|nr:PepSY-like domain-containing protein [Brumimicrobium sp.]
MNSRKLIGNAIIATAIGIVAVRLKKEKLIYIDKLPVIINEYIKAHFASRRILKATQVRNGFKKTFNVFLDGKINLEFNNKAEIIEIEGNSKLPDSVIPDKILDFVSSNYPDNVIIEWELEHKMQEVELDSGRELIFNLRGDFLFID